LFLGIGPSNERIIVSQSDSLALDRNWAIRRFRRADRAFHFVTFCAAIAVLLIFAGIIWAVAVGAWPALERFGFPFVWTEAWNPVKENFGALAPIYGTLVTSAIAMLIAVPVGIGIAIFLTELCPRPLRRPIGIAVELLAGIPSIIYGMWGLFFLVPELQHNFQPWVIEWVTGIPFLEDLFAGPPYGLGMFTAGVVLAIMILPFIAAITRDVFETVPHVLKESAYALGSTTWEVIWNVVLPYARGGVAGGAMLALGRALGETMAVTFVVGNAHKILPSLFAPATTISATIANEFTEAVNDIHYSSLIALGLILFFLTTIVLALAQYMLYRLERRAGGGHK
jgi:phosphate transport system permease protein